MAGNENIPTQASETRRDSNIVISQLLFVISSHDINFRSKKSHKKYNDITIEAEKCWNSTTVHLDQRAVLCIWTREHYCASRPESTTVHLEHVTQSNSFLMQSEQESREYIYKIAKKYKSSDLSTEEKLRELQVQALQWKVAHLELEPEVGGPNAIIGQSKPQSRHCPPDFD